MECNSCCRAAVPPRYAPPAPASGSVSEKQHLHCPSSLSETICWHRQGRLAQQHAMAQTHPAALEAAWRHQPFQGTERAAVLLAA